MRQRLCCIDSLGTFSSVLQNFVVIAPTAVHKDTQLVCDKASYARRGWCRLEQWGHMCNMGMKDMFFYDGGKKDLAELDDTPEDDGQEWYEHSPHAQCTDDMPIRALTCALAA